MLEQLKMLAQVFTSMAGNATDAEIRASILAQNDETDDDGKPVAYENLSERDKAGVDEAVASMKELATVFDRAIDAKAVMTYKFFKSLQKAGFSPAEALQITAAQGADMVKGSS